MGVSVSGGGPEQNPPACNLAVPLPSRESIPSILQTLLRLFSFPWLLPQHVPEKCAKGSAAARNVLIQCAWGQGRAGWWDRPSP